MAKKKKVLIAGGVTLGIIGIFILLLFTLFALKNAEVDFRTSRVNLSATQEEIIETADLSYKSPVLFHSKKKYVSRLEKAYPYIKVINIETVFPNKFVIHVSERQEVYAVEGEGFFYICDEDFKVLRKTEKFESVESNAILLSGIEVKSEKDAGEFLPVDGYVDIYSSFVENNRLLFEQQALVKEINFEKAVNEKTNLEEVSAKLTLFSGNNIKILNCSKSLTLKVTSAIQVFSQLYSLLGKEIKIVSEDGQTEVVGVWDEDNLRSAVIEIGSYYTSDGIYYKVLPLTQLESL